MSDIPPIGAITIENNTHVIRSADKSLGAAFEVTTEKLLSALEKTVVLQAENDEDCQKWYKISNL
jgi:hypothetical protein